MVRITPETTINTYLVSHGYEPVKSDATIHDCYLCILHFNKFETILGNIDRRRSAIVRAIAETEPVVSESMVMAWVKTAYKGVE